MHRGHMHPRHILEPNHMHQRHPQTHNMKTEEDEGIVVAGTYYQIRQISQLDPHLLGVGIAKAECLVIGLGTRPLRKSGRASQ
jgi:hypothetical protein